MFAQSAGDRAASCVQASPFFLRNRHRLQHKSIILLPQREINGYGHQDSGSSVAPKARGKVFKGFCVQRFPMQVLKAQGLLDAFYRRSKGLNGDSVKPKLKGG